MQNKIDWQKVDGLLPVIVQNAQTCEVLMLGYMNQQALEKTLAEKRVTFTPVLNNGCGRKAKPRAIS
ncbi:Histidine biosynthesis bifunctional protein HisIE [Mannheimia haemolytica]